MQSCTETSQVQRSLIHVRVAPEKWMVHFTSHGQTYTLFYITKREAKLRAKDYRKQPDVTNVRIERIGK